MTDSALMPSDSASVLGKDAARCESRSLRFERLPNYQWKKERFLSWALHQTRATCDAPHRWLESVPSGVRRREVVLQTAARLAVGLTTGALEGAGMTMHRLYGLPMISGNSLKGLALDASREPSLGIGEGEQRQVFGNEYANKNASRGAVGFLDAFPLASGAELEIDVTTVHYPKYYGGIGNPEALDTENPRILPIPVVAKGVDFRFDLVCLDSRLSDAQATMLLEIAEKCLRHALVDRRNDQLAESLVGVGAKRTAGYGAFVERAAKPFPLRSFSAHTRFEDIFGGASLALELLTPCFCAPLDQQSPEIRVPSIRGQLRWWTRALYGLRDSTNETGLWGGLRYRRAGHPPGPWGSFAGLSTYERTSPAREVYPLCPHEPDKGRRIAIQPGHCFALGWSNRLSESAYPDLVRTRRDTLIAWALLGGLGGRLSRAAGSVWPAGWAPTIAEFEAALQSLPLLPHMAVKVLAQPASSLAGTRIPSYTRSYHAGRTILQPTLVSPDDSGETLRAIATNTVLDYPDELGEGRGNRRKASPLKLKVGRFTFGTHIEHRLIAVWDARTGRGDYLPRARKALVGAGKPLGTLLQAKGDLLLQHPSLDP